MSRLQAMLSHQPDPSFAISLTEPIEDLGRATTPAAAAADAKVVVKMERRKAALEDTAESPPKDSSHPKIERRRNARQASIAQPRATVKKVLQIEQPITRRATKRHAPEALQSVEEPKPVKKGRPAQQADPVSPIIRTRRAAKAAATYVSSEDLERVEKALNRRKSSRLQQPAELQQEEQPAPHNSIQKPNAPATADLAAAATIKLGCAKCRHSPRGCGTCRAKAAAVLPPELLIAATKLGIEKSKEERMKRKEQKRRERMQQGMQGQEEMPASAAAPAPADVDMALAADVEAAPAKDDPPTAAAAVADAAQVALTPENPTEEEQAEAAPQAMDIATENDDDAPAAAEEEERPEEDAREPVDTFETWWNPLDPVKVSQVQGAFHITSGAAPGELPLCRDSQISSIDTWLADRLQKAQGGSIYLSGLPGTGKSHTALELVRRCSRHATAENSRCQLPPALMVINCMSLIDPKQVTERILAGYRTACRTLDESDPLVMVPSEEATSHTRRGSSIGGGTTGNTNDPQEALRKIVTTPLPVGAAPAVPTAPKKGGRRSSTTTTTTGRRASTAGGSSITSDGRGMIVAVLDELDALLSGRHGDALVGELFALAHAPRSRLILVGIANSIDLVQQLMRPGGTLHRHNLSPAHEVFPAYLSSQVTELIAQRLESLPGAVFDPKSLQLCGRKIANGSGDMRRALQACSKAVGILVKEEQEKADKAATDALEGPSVDGAIASTSAAAASASRTLPAPRVGMRQMAAALAKVTGGIGSSNDNVTAIKGLPVPQQLLMVTVSKLLGDKMTNRGLAVKVPTAANTSAAARFIGSAPIAQPLLSVDPTPVKAKKNILAEAQRRRSSTAPAKGELTVLDLKAAHSNLCKKVGVTAYSSSEFSTAMDMLSSMGFIKLHGSAALGPKQRISLQIAEDDVLLALADVPVLKNVVGA